MTDTNTLTDSVDIAVTVTDVVEGVAPTITSGGSVSIPENTTVVTTVTARHSPIAYSIVGGADAALFTIDENTGELELPSRAGTTRTQTITTPMVSMK
ncbi:MAG: hypothetical protein R2932_16635 [Caldilineaceae bacterium]